MGKSFMKKFILFLLLTGMVGFMGCARTAGNIPKIADDDYPTVYMYREFKAFSSAEVYPIEVNGLDWFLIGYGDCVAFKIPAGNSEIVCPPALKRVRFLAEKGKKYYLFIREKSGPEGLEFRQLTEEEWNQKQNGCHWVQLK